MKFTFVQVAEPCKASAMPVFFGNDLWGRMERHTPFGGMDFATHSLDAPLIVGKREDPDNARNRSLRPGAEAGDCALIVSHSTNPLNRENP
jgi:hypothetical protein